MGDVSLLDRELRRAMAKASLVQTWRLAEELGPDGFSEDDVERKSPRSARPAAAESRVSWSSPKPTSSFRQGSAPAALPVLGCMAFNSVPPASQSISDQYPTSTHAPNFQPTSGSWPTCLKPNLSCSATDAGLGRAISARAVWKPRLRNSDSRAW